MIVDGGMSVGLDRNMAANPDLRTKPEVVAALVELNPWPLAQIRVAQIRGAASISCRSASPVSAAWRWRSARSAERAPARDLAGLRAAVLVDARPSRASLAAPLPRRWLGGLGIGLVGFPWIGEMLERFAGLPAPVAWLGLALFSAWTALPFGLWAVAMRAAPTRGAMAWLWPAIAWVGVSTPWPALFPTRR